MAADPKELVRRWGALKTHRRPYESMWDAIRETIYPQADPHANLQNPAEKRIDRYDNTGENCLDLFGSNLAGTLANEKTRWMQLETDAA
ncbi:MAG: hypothetical protein K2Q12_08020, partial [Rickettsiales bacterium]|nr:hypothetical protein [Rickettsiales bacterium]